MMAQIFADTDRSEDTLVEDLLDALPSGTIDVCMPEALRRELDAAGPEREAELIKFLRDGLYEELGILYPEFRFISEERLKPNFTAFRINHLTTLPILCLRPDQCLVNDTVERLRSMNVEGWETTNPATWHPNAIVDVKHTVALEAAGLTTWDQWGFLILALAGELRKNNGCFVHRTFTELQLSELRTAFPAVVRTVVEFFSIDEITRVLRTLAGEQVSVRDLRFICESLLEFRYQPPNMSRYLIEADGGFAAGLVSFVRAQMYRQISFKVSRGSKTVVVYLLDLELEESVARFRIGVADQRVFGSPEDEEQKDVILDSIQVELQHLPPTTALPLLLTSTIEVRSPLKKIIAKEFPHLFVISYHELAPEVNVAPVARISAR